MHVTKVAVSLALSLALLGCATSTAPGAVGVERSQLLIVSSAQVNAQAALAYSQETLAARNQGKLLPADSPTVIRVRRVADRLIKEVGVFRQDAVGWAWEVNVIKSDQVNAFCMPGGKIAIYTGIIDRLKLTDGELAAVMGHEVAHALREHSREKASQGVLSNAVVQGVANSGSRNASTAANATRLGSELFFRRPFSREMEVEADSMGLELMARAGYDPAEAPNVWRKMMAQSGGGSGFDFLDTHPSHDKRISGLEALAPRVAPLYAARAATQPVSTASQTDPVTQLQHALQVQTPSPDAPNVIMVGDKKIISAPSVEPGAPRLNIVKTGFDSYTADQLSRKLDCGDDKPGKLIGQGPGYETYSYQCRQGETLIVRCERGNCRALK